MKNAWRNSFYEVSWPGRPLPAVKWLLAANLAVFCLQILLRTVEGSLFQKVLPLNGEVIRHWWLWQYLTYAFLHAGVWHLLINLFMLYLFGNEVEAEIGTRRFLLLYAFGAISGGLLWTALFWHWGGDLVGASSAIYAVTIAFAVLFPNRPITVPLFYVFLPVTLPSKYWALGTTVVSILLALFDSGNVSYLAHLGGAAAGYFFIKAVNRQERSLSVEVRTGQRPSPHRPLETISSPFDGPDLMSQRIDPILDKIANKGIQSLTREERRLLEQTKDRLS
jgi:membrane associated rhomboid family serine protease